MMQTQSSNFIHVDDSLPGVPASGAIYWGVPTSVSRLVLPAWGILYRFTQFVKATEKS